LLKVKNEFKLKDGFECGATITQDIASIEIKEADIDHWTR
jgi:hypothetical protein